MCSDVNCYMITPGNFSYTGNLSTQTVEMIKIPKKN